MPVSAALPADVAQPTGFLQILLSISLTAVAVLRPLYAADGHTIADFAWVYLNEAGQQALGLPERPAKTLLAQYPGARQHESFDLYCQAFATGEPRRYQTAYQADGVNGHFLVATQRYEDLLVVSFTDAIDRPQVVEQALRESQAREQQSAQQLEAAQATAERERTQLQALLTQAPVAIGLFEGDELRVSAVNPLMATLLGYSPTQLLGRPLFEQAPELQGQGFEELMRQVQATQVPFVGQEVAATVQRHGAPAHVYFNFVYQPLYDDEGQVTGIINVATDVTEQVLARQQLERLNQELEARVQQRTRQLSEQQALLGQILGQVPAAIATLSGPEHRFTFFNDGYQQLNGQRTRLGATLAEVVPEAAEQGFRALLDEVYRTGEPYVGSEVSVWLRQADGISAPYYVDFRYQPLHDEAGQVQGILIFAVDVTRQVHARQQAAALQADLLAVAQRQVAEHESFYQVFEQTEAVVALLRGPHHRYEYVNPPYQALLPGRPLVGRTVAEVVPELYAQGFGALLDGVYQTGETFFGDGLPFTANPVPGQDSRTRYFNFTYQAYREAGEVVGISIFAFDVTEQVLERQQQQAQQQRLRHVFAQAPVAIFVLRGADYVVDVVNASMGQMLGMDPGYMLGKGYFELLPGLAAQGYRQLLDHVWHTGQDYIAQEQAARLPHHGANETGYYNFVYTPLYEANERLTGIMCVAVDVTAQVLTRQQVQALNAELTATNAELQQANQQLTRTNVDLDTFVYTASHDLKAPITNIEGITLALREALPAAVQQDGVLAHLLDLLTQTTARFQFTIAQLTDLSKLQRAHAGPAEPVRLMEVVEAVRLDLAPAIAAADVQLTTEVAPELVVSFSPANLRSAIYNLLSNAVKYRALDRPAQVAVRATRTGQQVAVQVQDNGLGLNAHQLQRLFGLFQRLHTHVEGTGVGLYITKRLVENGGGTIVVESQLGVGTTFTITLPA